MLREIGRLGSRFFSPGAMSGHTAPHFFSTEDHMIDLFQPTAMLALLEDLCTVENQPIPGFARHAWVIARQIQRHSQSPPPWAISLLIIILDRVIPILVDWLKQRYGNAWPQHVRDCIAQGRLPWQSSNSPPSPPKSEAQ